MKVPSRQDEHTEGRDFMLMDTGTRQFRLTALITVDLDTLEVVDITAVVVPQVDTGLIRYLRQAVMEEHLSQGTMPVDCGVKLFSKTPKPSFWHHLYRQLTDIPESFTDLCRKVAIVVILTLPFWLIFR
jgi:hypothetical protein